MDWKAYDANRLLKVLKGSVMPVVPAVRLWHSAAQSLAAGSFQTITFDTEHFDTDGMHNPGVNPSRITFQTAGKYLVFGNAQVESTNVGTTRALQIRRDGATVIASSQHLASAYPVAPADLNIEVMTVHDFAVGQYIELRSLQDTGGAKNIFSTAEHTPIFGAVYLGPGIMASGGIGERELGYKERTSNLSVTATTEGTAQEIVGLDPLTFDGKTTVIIEFQATAARADTAAANRKLTITLFQDGTAIGQLGVLQFISTGQQIIPLHHARRLTPSAGSHTYSVRAFVDAGTGSIFAGVGGSGSQDFPAFARIKRVN